MKANITISRTQGVDSDAIRLQIHSDDAGFIIAAEIGLEDFARILTGEIHRECRLIRCNLTNK